ncbi:Clp protease N-terminal domain-containing protein [Streptomyces sp. JB150]|uniref:Clp protease N-terminal domain-containing protein n=1 Tax=Streptomyces sp. JB150 TaxID=2714844 RepID=UPI001F103A9B|nr:Clp protease N-terminal domain-containing protein [Streptomyces sp. JB150]
MRPRNLRRPGHDQGTHHVDDDAGFGAELASVLTAARRRAVRDGDRQTDTAHLLHSLLEYDPEVRALLDGGPQLARLLGYLVQRSIGYGLRWQGSVEDSGAAPAVPGPAGWSPVAVAALAHACGRAVGRGDGRACGTDLLAGIVADPGARAVEVLRRAGVDVVGLRARLDDRPVGDRPTGDRPMDDRPVGGPDGAPASSG